MTTRPMTLDERRDAWAADWQAMKAGTYTAPLPHPAMFRYEPDPRREEAGKTAAALRWGKQ